MASQNKAYEQFIEQLNASGLDYEVETLNNVSPEDKTHIGSVYSNVCDFLDSSNLIPQTAYESLTMFDKCVPAFNKDVTVMDIGVEGILDLCKACKIEPKYYSQAVEAVGHCIAKYGSEGRVMSEHFEMHPNLNKLSGDMKELSTMFSTQAISNISSDAEAAMEAFGKDIDKTIVDAKVAVAITLLRFHRSVLSRMIPNRPEDQNFVLFNVDNLEMYDLNKSRDASSEERYHGSHRVPFIDLYRDPSPANTTTKPIVLLTANDDPGNPSLYAENQPLFGKTINMFDYSLQPGVLGYSHVDYTDLVSEGAKIKNIIIKVTDGTTTEYIVVPVSSHGGSRFVMSNNSKDSGDRVANLRDYTILNNTTVISTGVATTLLAGLSADAFIKVDYNVQGSLNLKTSDVSVLCAIDTALKTQSGSAPIAGDTTIFTGLTITPVAWEPDARFNEENIRKTTKAMRIMTRTFGYEIPGNASVIAQYSIAQSRPETVIDAITKLINIGLDDRGIKLFLDAIDTIYDRLQTEKAYGDTVDYTNKVMNDFVAGHQVYPAIYRDSFDVASHLTNIRTGDIWGDLKTTIEKTLLEILTRIYQESFYTQALDPGEKPTFNVLTSGYILSSLLAVPHYHTELDNKVANVPNDGKTEYRRVLPDGTILNVMTTTFNYMTDKMIIIPNRPTKTKDPLNFAQNVDRGTFVAQVTPYVEGAISKQVVANARQFPIITCPVGILLQITNLSAIFDGAGSLGI